MKAIKDDIDFGSGSMFRSTMRNWELCEEQRKRVPTLKESLWSELCYTCWRVFSFLVSAGFVLAMVFFVSYVLYLNTDIELAERIVMMFYSQFNAGMRMMVSIFGG